MERTKRTKARKRSMRRDRHEACSPRHALGPKVRGEEPPRCGVAEGQRLGVTVREGFLGTLAESKVVIFEFEGAVTPYISTEHDVSKILSSLAKRTSLKLNFMASRDMPELLRALDSSSTELAEAGEREATNREIEVLEGSLPNPGLRFLLKALQKAGVKTACVGSSSTAAIEHYLASLAIPIAFDIIVGRPLALSHMLPQPHTLVTALHRAWIADTNHVALIASSEDAAKAASSLGIRYIYLRSDHNKVSPETARRKELFIESLVELGKGFGEVELSEAEKGQLRVEELLRKGRTQGLTWPEMVEMFRLTSKEYRSLGNMNDFGYVNPKFARENLLILSLSRREAARQNLVLEVFASTAIMIEMELRNWFIACKGRRFAATDKHTLGQLVRDAKREGFDTDLIARLEAFVRLRNIGIHRVITGEGRYFGIGQDFMKDPAIFEDVKEWVATQLPSTPV